MPFRWAPARRRCPRRAAPSPTRRAARPRRAQQVSLSLGVTGPTSRGIVACARNRGTASFLTMKKPTSEELVRRVAALEASVDQMLGALKADLAALRADLL